MATTIGALQTSEIIMEVTDYTGEAAKLSIPLDGTASDANLIAIVDDYIALTNGLVVPRLVRTYPFAGYDTAGKPSSESQNLIAAIFAAEFQKANPLNAAKTVSKQLALLAYIDAIRNDDVKPHVAVTDNATLNALIALLEAHLDYVGADAAHYAGGFTFNPASKFGTKLSVTDGF